MNRVVTWYMGSGLKAQNMTGIRAQRKGLRAQRNGIRDHKAFEPKSGIRFITRPKNLYFTIFFPHNKVCVRRISCQGTLPILASGWRQFLSYEVLVVWRTHGIIFLIDTVIIEGTVIWISSHFSRFVTQFLNALSTPEGRESDLYISFLARNGQEEKGQKEILWQRKVRKYFLDWFTPGKGPSIEFFGRSNITMPPGQ